MVIKKENKKFILYSRDRSKMLGSFHSLKQAMKREKQIRYFKYVKKKSWRNKK